MDTKDTSAGPSGTWNTARHTLGAIALLAETNLTPIARGLAVANTLREVAASPAGDLPLTLQGAYVGYSWLSLHRPDDTATVTSRRKTCNELALLIEAYGKWDVTGDQDQLAEVLRGFAKHVNASTDPRMRAIVATFEREAGEITKRSAPAAD